MSWVARSLLLPGVLFAIVGCDFYPPLDEGTDGEVPTTIDAGAGTFSDGGMFDGAPEGVRASTDSSGVSMDPSDPDVGACFGEDGAELCAAAQCGLVRSCCVDDGTCCAPLSTPPTPDVVDVSMCGNGAPARDCLPPSWVFGAPEPWVSEGGIAPGGDDNGDSGLLMGSPVDLATQRVVLEGTFLLSSRCEAGCVESVALGVTAQSTIVSAVRPIAALVSSGSRRRMSFVVGDTTVAQWDAMPEPEGWSLDLQPSGVAIVKRAGVVVAQASIARERNARAVLYGRTLNSTSAPTRVVDVHVRTSLCDMADAFIDRTSIAVRALGGEPLSGEIHTPSLALIDGRPTVAFAIDGALYITAETAPGELTATTPTPLLTVANLALSADVALDDPELVQSLAGTRLLFFTIRHPSGGSEIGVATLSEDLTTTTAVQGSIAGLPAVLEQASVHAHALSGLLVLIARQHDADATRLVIFTSADDGASFSEQRSANLSTMTERRATPTNLPTFDSDEIGHPSLTVHDGAWHLAYAGRKGSRWAIGTLVSDDLVWWRALHTSDGVFVSSRSSTDVVGVTEPDILITAESLRVMYTALDGVTTHLSTASRPVGYLGIR